MMKIKFCFRVALVFWTIILRVEVNKCEREAMCVCILVERTLPPYTLYHHLHPPSMSPIYIQPSFRRPSNIPAVFFFSSRQAVAVTIYNRSIIGSSTAGLR